MAWAAAARFDTTVLLAFAARNFVYSGASDLVPEVNRHREMKTNVVHFWAFVAGVVLLAAIRLVGR